jgi:hypothetical protein
MSKAWMANPDRACADTSWDLLFGPREIQHDLALLLCAHCPVQMECRNEGKTEAYGLYGGIPQGGPGRPRIYKGRDGDYGCGTDAGYKRHVRSGIRPCRLCLDAHAQAEADRKWKRTRAA